MIVRPQDRDHRLRVDRRHQFVRVASNHREVSLIADLSPETGDREHGLIRHPEPHLPLDRLLAVAEVGGLTRLLAKLPQRDKAPIFPRILRI